LRFRSGREDRFWVVGEKFEIVFKIRSVGDNGVDRELGAQERCTQLSDQLICSFRPVVESLP